MGSAVSAGLSLGARWRTVSLAQVFFHPVPVPNGSSGCPSSPPLLPMTYDPYDRVGLGPCLQAPRNGERRAYSPRPTLLPSRMRLRGARGCAHAHARWGGAFCPLQVGPRCSLTHRGAEGRGGAGVTRRTRTQDSSPFSSPHFSGAPTHCLGCAPSGRGGDGERNCMEGILAMN